jgi:hypothetical protein
MFVDGRYSSREETRDPAYGCQTEPDLVHPAVRLLPKHRMLRGLMARMPASIQVQFSLIQPELALGLDEFPNYSIDGHKQVKDDLRYT